MSRLNDMVVLVTGGAQGIGAHIAKACAAEGASVVIADLLDGAPVAEQISRDGGKAIPVICDVTDPPSIDEAMKQVLSTFGRLDCLINNAALFGKVQNVSLFDIDPDDWDKMMAVNVKGPWQVAKASIPLMEKSANASIINIATNRVWVGGTMLLHYDASKGAVLAMTRSMARELSAQNVRVNAVAPGLTMSENVLNREGIKDRAPQIAANRLIKRDQLPEDVVGAVVFLASQDASFITGQTLTVDGGSTIH